MIKQIIKENPLVKTALVLGKKLDKIISILNENNIEIFGIERTEDIQNSNIKEVNNGIYIKSAISFELKKRYIKLDNYDLILIKDVKSLLINFDHSAKFIKSMMHNNSIVYIAIDDVEDDYANKLALALAKEKINSTIDYQKKIIKTNNKGHE